MANTGIRQLTTNVGGVIKRIWYSLNGTTPTNELMSIDDTGKFKCVSEQVTGLAGTGSRPVAVDSLGNFGIASIKSRNYTATTPAAINGLTLIPHMEIKSNIIGIIASIPSTDNYQIDATKLSIAVSPDDIFIRTSNTATDDYLNKSINVVLVIKTA